MKVEILRHIHKDLRKISDRNILESFYDFVEECEIKSGIWEIENIKKLQGFKESYRYRIWDYRVWLRYSSWVCYIERILHRKDIYKVFP